MLSSLLNIKLGIESLIENIMVICKTSNQKLIEYPPRVVLDKGLHYQSVEYQIYLTRTSGFSQRIFARATRYKQNKRPFDSLAGHAAETCNLNCNGTDDHNRRTHRESLCWTTIVESLRPKGKGVIWFQDSINNFCNLNVIDYKYMYLCGHGRNSCINPLYTNAQMIVWSILPRLKKNTTLLDSVINSVCTIFMNL